MKCIADILILFMIRDIKQLWLGGGYYGAPIYNVPNSLIDFFNKFIYEDN